MFSKIIQLKWNAAAGIYVLFIIYGTTIPFIFTLSPEIINSNIHRSLEIFHGRFFLSPDDKADALANILFFLPFGFFFLSALIQKNFINFKFSALFKVTLAGLLVSFFVESLQVFTPNRSASFLDIITNTSGTFIGALTAYFLIKKKIYLRVYRFAEQWIKDPDILIIGTYLSLLLISGLAPYNFTLSPSSLSRHVQLISELKTGIATSPMDLFNLIFIYGTGGYLFARTIRKYALHLSHSNQTILSLGIGIFVCAGIETMQIFVASRFFSWTDLLMGSIGILYGTATYQILHPNLFGRNIHIAWKSDDNNVRLVIFFSINYTFFLLYKFSYPFIFSAEPAYILKKLNFLLFNVHSFIPSSKASEIFILFTKYMILFAPAGVIYYEIRNIKHKAMFLMLSLLFIIILKTLQLFNTDQAPMLIDFTGIFIGIMAGYYFWREFRNLLLTTR
ncbi:MAG: VanZ family protein [Calditrichaceae bacterium]